MRDFYLNVKQYGNDILYVGVRNGKKVRARIPYSPALFVPTHETTKYKTLYGESLKKVKPGSIKLTRAYIEKFSGIENFKIYGNTRYEYCLISDLYKDDIEWDYSKIRVAIIDIEVNSDPQKGGFAGVSDPFQPITSIAVKFVGEEKYYLFGYEDFDAPSNVLYTKCKDEYTLCKKFIEMWSLNYPDIISGWNTQSFDIPYIINRFEKILGKDQVKKLSPWGIIREHKVSKFNEKFNKYEEEVNFSILGISSLDYMLLYKKYHPGGNSQESYKLDNIAYVEVGENKIDYKGSLHRLYVEDIQKFYLYNLKDVELIEKLDAKCKLFELGLTLAYDSKTNFEDIFQQTRMWDALIYDFLKKKGIQVHQCEVGEEASYEGAYVKPPIPGLHKWIVTLDATSLYPSIIMGKNISPETLVRIEDYNEDLRSIISNQISVDSILSGRLDLSKLKENNVTLTPNGRFFRTDEKGFLPEMVEKMFNARKEYKNKKLRAETLYEILENEIKARGSTEYKDLSDAELEKERSRLSNEVSKYNNLQNAKKLCLNSLYGCLGTKYFRFFDVYQAEAITLEGQLSIRWMERGINSYLNKILKQDKDYVVGIDTDSLIISLEDLVNSAIKSDVELPKVIEFLSKVAKDKIQPMVDGLSEELLQYVNSYSNKINFKLEKICSTGVFVAKKRYALNVYSNEGVVYSEPKVKVTGLEIVKSSTPTLVRSVLKECLRLILLGDVESVQAMVSDFKSKFNDFAVEDISFPRGVNGLNKYFNSTSIYAKGTPIHVRGSILYNKILEDKNLDSLYEYIKDGDKIKFCYLKVPNHIQENVISYPETLPPEFDLSSYIDYNTMFNKVFLDPLKSITDVIKWDLEKKNRIDDFF